MNQILDYNPNKNPKGNSSGTDKIVRVFAILLAVFAICLLGAGGYGLYKNNAKSKQLAEVASDAKIEIEQKESSAIIKVSHDKIIEKIIYSWDSGKETTVKGAGESSMETEISVFKGEHTLNIKVVDINGHETVFKQSITSEDGADNIYPVIELKITDEKKLKITATDETAIDFVTFRWDDEEEEKVEVDGDDKKIEFEIDIQKGNHDLTIIAVDKSKNTTTETKSFTGVTKPEVSIEVIDLKKIEVKCYHEKGLKAITLSVNGEEMPLEYEGTPDTITFEYELPEGNNNITVKAISVEDTETVASEMVENLSEEDRQIKISIDKSEEFDDRADVKIETESQIENIILTLNGQEYSTDEKEFSFQLSEGENKISVKVELKSGLEKTETAILDR